MNLWMIILITTYATAVQAEEVPCSPEILEKLSLANKNLRGYRLAGTRTLLEEVQPKLSGPQCDEIRTTFETLYGRLLLDEGRLTELSDHFSGLSPPRDESNLIRYLNTSGGLAYQLGQYDEAREYYKKVLKIDLAQDNSSYVAEDLYTIANTYADQARDFRDQGDVYQAYKKALDYADPKNSIVSPLIYLAIGRLTDGEKGKVWLQGLVERKDLQPSVRVGALKTLALRILEQQPENALKHIAEAQKIGESAWLEDENPWPKMELTNDRIAVRWATLDRAEALADANEALAFLEEMRIRQSKDDQRTGLFSVWMQAYHRIVGRVLLANKLSDDDLALAFHFMERYRARSLTDAVQNADKPFAELNEIVRQLGKDEALFAFQLAPSKDVYGRFAGGSWLLVAHRGGNKVYALPERADLVDRMVVYLDLLRSGDLQEKGMSERLYRDLLAEALAELPPEIDKLLLVPDGDLHLLPFASLQSEGTEPLGLRYQLTNLPSASLWLRWRQAPPRAEQTAALVLANPATEDSSALTRLELGELPHAEEEGRLVLKQIGRDSVLRLGDQASEAAFKNENPAHFGILHLAAHAVVDNIDPRRSAVHLAAGDGEDGALHGEEIAQLDLDQRIALLSTCHSATGRIVRGEGVMSLARSFFEAGATTVIGSLWPLDDHQTQLLFEEFYRHLSDGKTIRASLQQAQIALRKRGAPTAAWAGLVILGDGARQPLPADKTQRWIFVAAIALLCLAFLLFIWRWQSLQRREASSS